MTVTAKLITILTGMEIGLKSFVISRTTGLYGLKFAKSSALADDFSYLISYNWSVLLQLASEHGLACYCSQVYLKQKGIWKMCF